MPPRRKPLPNPLPNGYILTDTEKKQWKLGEIIGQGGFGLIYLGPYMLCIAQTAAHIIGKNYEIDNYLLNGINSLKSSVGIIIAFGYTASRRLDAPVPSDSDFVIKVEYHENGPLFSELKFYQRAAKPESIQRWKKRHGLDFLGIPSYFGSGLAEHNGTRYRFMVMDRLGKDLQKVCAENGGRLKRPTVLTLGCLLLDMLEFIHENEYVHADIKAANLLLGHRDPSKVYLADYGLSYRYCPEGVHKEYKENPKKGHNGTIEYTSTDAHNGVAPSRRGDLEVLGYCLLHWLCGKLPWDSMLKRPVMVQEAKAKLMANLPDSIIELSPSGTSTGEVAKFLLSVKSLGYKERPDYLKLRNILSEGLSKTARKEGPLDLSGPREEARGPTPRCKPMKVKPTAVEAPRPRPPPQEDSGCAAKADLPGRPPIHQRRPKMQPRLSHPQDEKKRQTQPKQMARRVEVYDDDESDNEPNSENQGSPHHPYSLRERPPSKQDTSWGLKHWGGVITILFFLIFVILLVLEPQIPWSRRVVVL